MKVIVILDSFDKAHAQLEYGIELAKYYHAELLLYDLQQLPQLPSELRLTYDDYQESKIETRTITAPII